MSHLSTRVSLTNVAFLLLLLLLLLLCRVINGARISGTLPPSLGNMSFLRSLNVHGETMLVFEKSRISGTLPPSMWRAPLISVTLDMPVFIFISLYRMTEYFTIFHANIY